MKSYPLVTASIENDLSDLVHIFFLNVDNIPNEHFKQRQIEKCRKNRKAFFKWDFSLNCFLFISECQVPYNIILLL